MNAQAVVAGGLAALFGVESVAWAQTETVRESAEAEEDEEAAEDDATAGAAADAPPTSPLMFRGYVDVGFARAEGDGTSFAPGDTRLPADYGVDTFAPAVNSRGDVASSDPNGRFVNGFLPSSAGIGGKPSFLLNVVSLEARYEPKASPITVFSRVHLLPRLLDGQEENRLLLEQAFGRIQPFASQELTVTAGKFDSVFGIEYLENQSNFRTGITPSLFARYTTGTSIGVKVFYRVQIPALWSALSINAAATNSGNMVASLQGSSRSLTGMPVGSARLGYELNLPWFGVKLGASGLYGPRNDQSDDHADQRMLGVDARLFVFGLVLSGEYMRVDEGMGAANGKSTGLGTFPLASGFHARGFYGQAAYTLPISYRAFRRLTLYGRFERRHASFTGFTPIEVDRLTGGLRADLWEFLIVKVEALRNGEVAGAPTVANDVLTSSVVFAW